MLAHADMDLGKFFFKKYHFSADWNEDLLHSDVSLYFKNEYGDVSNKALIKCHQISDYQFTMGFPHGAH